MSEHTEAGLPEVRRARRNDLESIAEALAASFVRYRWTLWTVPGSENNLPRLRDLHLAYLTTFALPHRAIWTTADRQSAAAFVPHPPPSPDPEAWARIANLHGAEGLERIERHERAAESLRPHHDWLLASVGTHPEYQGRGYGTAVISAGLRMLDARRETCLLETSTNENARLYTRFGFTTVASLQADSGSPPVSIMFRSPGSTSR